MKTRQLSNKALDDKICGLDGLLRPGDKYEIVTADMTGKAYAIDSEFLCRLDGDAADLLDDLVAHGIAMLIVVGFERINIDIADIKMNRLGQHLDDFTLDKLVAGHSGERVGALGIEDTLICDRIEDVDDCHRAYVFPATGNTDVIIHADILTSVYLPGHLLNGHVVGYLEIFTIENVTNFLVVIKVLAVSMKRCLLIIPHTMSPLSTGRQQS